MRTRDHRLRLVLIFILLLVSGGGIFHFWPRPSPAATVSPIPSSSGQTLAASIRRDSPFARLLRETGNNLTDATGAQKSAAVGEGVPEESVGSEGLLDRLLKTLADSLRVTPAPALTPLPIVTPAVLGVTATPVPFLTADQQQIKSKVELWSGYLSAANYAALYPLMGENFRQTFSVAEFQDSLAGGLPVARLELQDSPQMSGDWAESKITVVLVNGGRESYKAVFHKENGDWYLFGTGTL